MEPLEGQAGPEGTEFSGTLASVWEVANLLSLGILAQGEKQRLPQNEVGSHGTQPYWFTSHLEQARAPTDSGHSASLGGPVQFLSKLLGLWKLPEGEAFRLLGFDAKDRDYVARVLAGIDQLHGRDVRERISHLVWIRATLRSLFQDLEVENEWLRESHELLDDRCPLSLMLEGSISNLKLAREYVRALAGR